MGLRTNGSPLDLARLGYFRSINRHQEILLKSFVSGQRLQPCRMAYLLIDHTRKGRNNVAPFSRNSE